MDFNSNAVVDYTEFLTACVNKTKILTEENLQKAFNIIDKNNNGRLDKKELKQAFELKQKSES